MTRKRRNVRTALIATLALALLALWPVWRLGIGGAGTVRDDDGVPDAQIDPPRGAEHAAPSEVTQRAETARGDVDAARDARVVEEASTATSATPSTASPAPDVATLAEDPGVDTASDPSDALALDDRLHGLLEGAADAVERGHWIVVADALRVAAGLPLDAARERRVLAARDRARAAFADHVATVLALWRDGRVLEGATLARPLVQEEDRRRVAALREWWLQLGAPDIWRARREAAPLPQPANDLARGRAMRWLADDATTRTALVVDADADTVSVRFSDGGRVFHPVLARARVEPVDATVDEAIDQAIVALAHGDTLLAVAWLANARPRADDVQRERCDAVERALSQLDETPPRPDQSR